MRVMALSHLILFLISRLQCKEIRNALDQKEAIETIEMIGIEIEVIEVIEEIEVISTLHTININPVIVLKAIVVADKMIILKEVRAHKW